VADYHRFASDLGFASILPIPMSARHGDNVVERSDGTGWYRGPCLLDHLERIDVGSEAAGQPFRFPVQWVSRPHQDFRGYAGTVASGSIAVGDAIVVAASERMSRVTRILTYDGDLVRADAGDAVTLTLDDDIDVGRGDMLTRPDERPELADQFAAHLIWMDGEALVPGRSYLLRAGTQTVSASVTAIKHKVDVNSGDHLAAATLGLNEIGFCNLATKLPLAFDAYKQNRRTGSFILIDRYNHRTVGAGMIRFALRRATNIAWQPLSVGKAERANLKNQKPCIVWLTGLSGAGKSTIANLVEQKLSAMTRHTMLLDGDNVRHGLNRDLGFTEADRVENIRRAGEVAKLMVDAGLIVICSFISPYRAERRMIRDLVANDEFIEVHVDTPLQECARRDPKGLYAKAKDGRIKNFTGLDAPYEIPESPELRLATMNETAERLADRIIRILIDRGHV
jgi:bifunctional enzyme CysN/CysC